MKRIIILFILLLLYSCKSRDKKIKTLVTNKKPNILWIYLEDTAPLLSCYNASNVATPHIDSLAKNGVLFTNVHMPAPVCSASRSSIITGMMSTTTGTHNHHSSRTKESAIHLPEYLKTIPELFKKEGYFTFNNGKDDYNFIYNRKELYNQDFYIHPLYGKSGVRINLDSLQFKQPFFGQIQLYGGKEIFASNFKEKVKKPVNRTKIILPPYLPYDPIIIEEYANHLDAIQITDEKIGGIIQKLKQNGILKNTIVFFFSDHGMRITRNKQFLYDGGTHVPLIIADFTNSIKKLPAHTTNENLISGLDLGITSLGLANIPIPNYMEGKNFLDKKFTQNYIISTRDRCDFSIDRIRSVRSKKYKYIKNFLTDRPYTQTTYMDADQVDFVKRMKELYKEKKLNSIQEQFMNNIRPSEELYDLINDPYELKNLASNPKYDKILKKFRSVLENWILRTDDKGQYPENEENLKLMLGIWGKYCTNPEYESIREKYPNLEGSLFYLKNEKFKLVNKDSIEDPLLKLNQN